MYIYISTFPHARWFAYNEIYAKTINQRKLSNKMSFQTITERAFDGLNNLKRLNLEHNRLKMLDRGTFVAASGLTYLNLMRNALETVTLGTVQPLMNNLVNHTSMILIKGNFCIIFLLHLIESIFFLFII
jgi:Leucine rich repeat